VPEVGLELHSNPCKHWSPAETCGIRASPADVRPSPEPSLWTLSTGHFRRFKAFRPTTGAIRGRPVYSRGKYCGSTSIVQTVSGQLIPGRSKPRRRRACCKDCFGCIRDSLGPPFAANRAISLHVPSLRGLSRWPISAVLLRAGPVRIPDLSTCPARSRLPAQPRFLCLRRRAVPGSVERIRPWPRRGALAGVLVDAGDEAPGPV
jgi:hypothetical protein